MATRNFWIDANIDGRATNLASGPRNKNGGMSVVIKQRSNGGITTAMKIVSREENGYLFTEIFDNDGKLIWTYQTER